MPDLEPLGRHALLVVSVVALGEAGRRLAYAALRPAQGEGALVAALAATVFTVSAAVLSALVLALAGLGSSPVALTAAALLVAALARGAAPAPPALDLRGWWRAVPGRERALAGAALGALAAWALWILRHPHVGLDGLTYHLSLVAAWMPGGDVGATTPVLEGVPVGNYPITHEVALAWATGIAGSWTPAVLAGPLLVLVLAASAWTGLRALGVDVATTVLALAALLTLPLVVGQVNAVATDLPALTWVAACAALAAAGVRRPPLLAFALLAAGLAVGTKTTAVVLAGAAVLFGAWAVRDRLRPLARPLTVALVAALGLAAVWPVRNLVDHGSPLWPLVAWPGGDPVPPQFEAIDDAFADHPGEMLSGRLDDYLRVLGGGAVLLLAALTVPLLTLERRAVAAAGVVLVALVAWVNAPYTGIASNTDLAVGATRYLLPCLGAAVVAVALAARGAARPVALGALVVATAWSLARDARLGFPLTPSVDVFIIGALAGYAFLRLAPRAGVRLALAALPVAAWLVLVVAAPAIVDRHARTGLPASALLTALEADPDFDGDGREMAMAPAMVGPAAGDRVQHRLQLVPGGESCPAVRERLGRGWVVLQRSPPTRTYTRLRACLRGIGPVHRDGLYELFRR